jgi:small nuclear ribonucleoprotein (snRNP)-like protein
MSTDVQHAAIAETLTNEEGKTVIDSWLNQRLRITIADSRSFEGWFKCVDREWNIVLSGTEEFRDGSSLSNDVNP